MEKIAPKNLTYIALLVLVAAIAACGGTKKSEVAADASAELRIPLRVEPTIFDPQRANVAPNIGVVQQLFRGLLWYDERLNLVPMAAKELPTQKNGGISKDGLVYTLKLRDGLKWSDGRPLMALDFEYSTKRLLDPATGAAKAAVFFDIRGSEKYNTCKECSPAELARLRDEVGVKATSPDTIVFTLKAPHAIFLDLLTGPYLGPVRQDVLEKYGEKWTDPGNLVGNGPFILQARVPKERVVLEPNPNWWGTQSRVKNVTFKIIPDILAGYNAYLADDVDLAEVPPDQKTTVDGDPILVKQNVRQPLLQTLGYFLNNKIPPFDNPKVRQAFALALDRDAFVADVLKGVGQPTYSWLPPAALGHSKELGLEWKYSPEKARAALAAAGYPQGKGLPPLTFPYRTTGLDPAYAAFFQKQIQQNLDVQVELKAMSPDEWLQPFLRGEHMISFVPFTPTTIDPGPSFEVFGCQKYEGEACKEFFGNNIARYSNPEVDRILQQAAKEPNTSRRVGYYSKAERIIVADVPAAFMITPSRNLLVKPRVRGLVPTASDGLFPSQYFLERAYIVAE